MRTSHTSAYQEMMINSKLLEVSPRQLPAGAERQAGSQDCSEV